VALPNLMSALWLDTRADGNVSRVPAGGSACGEEGNRGNSGTLRGRAQWDERKGGKEVRR
jgi:hypothetical protein